MLTIGHEHITLVALTQSEAITTRHERPTGTGQFRTIRLQMALPNHVSAEPASSSFVRRFSSTAEFFSQTRQAVPPPPYAAHRRCRLVFRGACITGPPTSSRPHSPFSSPLRTHNHRPCYASHLSPHLEWAHQLPKSVSQASALRSACRFLSRLGVAFCFQRSASRSTTTNPLSLRTHL